MFERLLIAVALMLLVRAAAADDGGPPTRNPNLEVLEVTVTAICACQDSACAERLLKEYARSISQLRHDGVPDLATPEEVEQQAALGRRGDDCARNLPKAPPPPVRIEDRHAIGMPAMSADGTLVAVVKGEEGFLPSASTVFVSLDDTNLHPLEREHYPVEDACHPDCETVAGSAADAINKLLTDMNFLPLPIQRVAPRQRRVSVDGVTFMISRRKRSVRVEAHIGRRKVRFPEEFGETSAEVTAITVANGVRRVAFVAYKTDFENGTEFYWRSMPLGEPEPSRPRRKDVVTVPRTKP